MKHLLTILAIFFWFTASVAQPTRVFGDDIYLNETAERLYPWADSMHLGVRDWIIDERMERRIELSRKKDHGMRSHQTWFARKMFDESLVNLDTTDFRLRVDVLGNLEPGTDIDNPDRPFYLTNTRGLLLRASITESIGFYSSFHENQASFPSYYSQYIDSNRVIPGRWRTKTLEEGYDYGYSMAGIDVRFSNRISGSLGHTKTFIGHGYRSMLLSDNQVAYPNLRLSYNGKKIRYDHRWASLQLTGRVPRDTPSEAPFIRKAANINYLSYKPNSKFEVAIMEAVVWRQWDDSTGSIPVGANYYVPLPFLNTALAPSNDDASAYGGFNVMYQSKPGLIHYGQFAWDYGDGVAFQLGTKWFDVFDVDGFMMQAELNQSDLGVFGGANDLGMNHAGQPLGSPLVNGFNEWVLIGEYHRNSWVVRAKYTLAQTQREFNRNSELQTFEYRLSYLMNTTSNLNAYICGISRVGDLEGSTHWISAGVQTSIMTFYRDY